MSSRPSPSEAAGNSPFGPIRYTAVANSSKALSAAMCFTSIVGESVDHGRDSVSSTRLRSGVGFIEREYAVRQYGRLSSTLGERRLRRGPENWTNHLVIFVGAARMSDSSKSDCPFESSRPQIESPPPVHGRSQRPLRIPRFSGMAVLARRQVPPSPVRPTHRVLSTRALLPTSRASSGRKCHRRRDPDRTGIPRQPRRTAVRSPRRRLPHRTPGCSTVRSVRRAR